MFRLHLIFSKFIVLYVFFKVTENQIKLQKCRLLDAHADGRIKNNPKIIPLEKDH